MKKYDNYKDSGIEWIGNIPKHWDVKKIKHLVKLQGRIGFKGYTVSDLVAEGEGVYTLGAKHISNNKINLSSPEYISWDKYYESPEIMVFKGDLLITQRGTLGKVALVENEIGEATINPSMIILKEIKPNSKFLYHLFCSNYFIKWIDLTNTATAVPMISQTQLNNLELPLPCLEEQTQIANYLDHKTTQIDNLITKKEQFITLLQEERTAVINQAVTKGLDPTVKMKDSGIEWLGEIPEHWEMKRMRFLCDITTGGKDTENREENGAYPFYVRSQTVERISSYSFDGEAILTAGDGVGVCKVWHYVNEKFDFHQRVYMLSNFNEILGKYLFYYLKENFGKEVMKLSAKSTVDSLRRPMFQNFSVSFGSIEEQKQIIKIIEDEETRIETIISKTQQEIELLKEYKTALISEVVTGKVDVRDVVLN